MWTQLITATSFVLMVSGASVSRITKGITSDSSVDARRTKRQNEWPSRIYPYPEYDMGPEPDNYPKSELYHNPKGEQAYYAEQDPAYHGQPGLTFYSKYDPAYYPKYVSYEDYKPSYDTKQHPCSHETDHKKTTHAPHTTYKPHEEPHTTHAPQTTTHDTLLSLPLRNPTRPNGLIISELLAQAVNMASSTQPYNYRH